MKRKAIALFARLTILVSVMLTCAQTMVPVKAQPPISSGWMTQLVTLDGQITTAKEWSDAIPMDLALRNTPGVTIPVRIWIKNDLKHFCVLVCVKWPASDMDGNDGFDFIIESGDILDNSYVPVFGRADDGCRLAVSSYPSKVWGEWKADTARSPPGKNDVEGGASYNGTHYLCEWRKELNTGDRYDALLVPSQTYLGVYLAMTDSSKRDRYQTGFIWQLAPVIPSVEDTTPKDMSITSASQVNFTSYVSGHLSKVTLVIGNREHDMIPSGKTGRYDASLTLTDGLYRWHVRAQGVLGNVTTIPERSLTVDTTSPVVTVRSPTLGEVVRESEVSITWEALDATSGIAMVEIKVDTSDWISVTGKTSHKVTGLAEGNHEVRVRATDKAGNVAEKVVKFTFLPPPWYVTYWYIPAILSTTIVAIAAIMISRRRLPVKPPEAKPLKIVPLTGPPTREELLKEMEELHRSGRITETAYRRLKRKYEVEGNQSS